MTAPLNIDPIWVDSPKLLDEMVRDLSNSRLVAIDTESNSLFAYQEQVCLIQFSTDTTDYLVDPLALNNLSSLGPIFANPATEKIFHAAEYDLICLKRDYGFHFENIFDTMQAARILGRTEVGLGSILFSEFEIVLEKKYQRANWGERPLDAAMLAYARLDSHYLIPLRHHLRKELIEKNRLELAQEDFARLTRVNIPQNDHPAMNYWKIAGKQELSSRQAAVLQSLCEYRDRQAQQANLPHFKVFGNQTLLEIALACPRTPEALAEATHLTTRQLNRHQQGLLRAVQHGLESSPPEKPYYSRPDENYLNRLDVLREWRKQTARDLGVESDIVLPRDVLEEIAGKYPRSRQQLNELLQLYPWRNVHYGDAIFKLLN